MALTARATEPPMWDNQIVPTLRKRLENESRALSKRMSIQATASDDPQPPPLGRSTSDNQPSSIPRPSLQLSEQTHATEPPRTSTSTSRPTRPRTHSTPRPFERDMPTPAPSRSNSPAVHSSPRPSRIPTRPRAGSRSRAPNDAAFPPSPEPSPDLWPVSEVRTELTPPTPNAPDHPRRKRDTFVPPPASDHDEILIDEPAPFSINTPVGPRTSLDEYEHWYRGEGRGGGGRNGGRGEIRVATRTEMLEIASFGHRPGPPHGTGSRDGHAYGASSELGWRTKAYDDSTVGTRSMWYGETTENVLDEAPLTDLDDVDTDSIYPPRSHDARSADSHAQTQERHTIESYAHTTGADPEPEDEPEPDPEPDGIVEPVTPAKQPPPSRIARATSPTVGPGASTTSLVSRPGRSPTPSKARSPPPSKAQSPKVGNASKSPARRGTAASTASKSPSRAAGTSQLTPKSPRVAPATPGSKNSTPSKNTTPSKRGRAQSTPKRTKKLSTGGVSGVPHPLADAIPPPSQTIPNDGNWDDVVLPTVARRMQGPDVVMLEGKPKPPPEEERIPPAPGSFGYTERLEELKRARERDRRRGSGLELDEFGEWNGAKKKTEEKTEERKKAPSPPPFAAYTPQPPPPPEVVRQPEPRPSPTPTAQPSAVVITEAELRQTTSGKRKDDDSHGAGCCKCVVM